MSKTSKKLTNKKLTSKQSTINHSKNSKKLFRYSNIKYTKKYKFIPNIKLFKTYKEKITIYEYILNLYKFIKNINRCFTSGAFVIEDPTQRLWRMLRFTDKKNVSKFIGLSHTAFKSRGHQYDRYILSIDDIKIRQNNSKYKDSSCKCLKEYPNQYQMVCIDCNKKSKQGKPIKQCKGIIKFYKFRYNGIVHVYLKLERWRTILINEQVKHWKQYKEKKKQQHEGIKRSEGDDRSEDCGLKCIENYKKDYHDKKGIPLQICVDKNKETLCKYVKDWNNRKGDELFIPDFINEALINDIIPYYSKK